MMFELQHLLFVSFAYLGLVFLVAIATEKHWLPKKLVHHPLIYTLSLGAYVGAWAMFGSLDLAKNNGFTFLAYYFGVSALLIFSPLILQPLLQLSKTYRLHSLADLLSFRYNSQWAGVFTTLCILISVLPLMAMQINTVVESALFLTHKDIYRPIENNQNTEQLLSLTFCIAIALFSLMFGNQQTNNQHRHAGLVVATAFQSLVKLMICIILGYAAMFMVFQSPAEMESWLLAQPGNLQQLNESLVSNNARTLTLIFFSATLAMPHMYHMALTENPSPRSINMASWAFPLLMMWIALPILPILWAGQASGLEQPAHFFSLAIGHLTESPSLSILAFICALAAASASIIVINIAVSSMCLNHLFLPFYSLENKNNIYRWLINVKRIFIVSLMVLTYVLYLIIRHVPDLHNFGYASFTAAFQFIPGILAVLYWPRANRTGLLAGLSVGFITWFFTIILPLMSADAFGLMPLINQFFSISIDNYWTAAAITSIGFNMVTFGLISLLFDADEDQRYVALLCSQDNLSRPTRQRLNLHSTDDFIDALAQALGQESALQEVKNATAQLSMPEDETRPFALRLLRRQIESNLSGLLGVTVARQIVARYLPIHHNTNDTNITDIGLIEHRLETQTDQLSGLASELDELRRYHRQTIEKLPIGICNLSDDLEILLWNKTMQNLTGISSEDSLGSKLEHLAEPWGRQLTRLINGPKQHQHKQQLNINGEQRWFTLHKTLHIKDEQQGQTLLLEEVTSTALLEQELLHSERLASIGRLAAGVAHEIGNPITGIACLAQNLKYDSDVPAIHEATRDILEQTQRVTRIVQSLVTFAHAGTHGKNIPHEQVSCFLCADDAVHLLSLEQKQLTDNVTNLIDQHHLVSGDAQRILQVFINLLKNALDAGGDDVNIQLSSVSHKNSISFIISDDGPGIPKELQEQVFDPFFTTKDIGEGTGLGLAMVYSIIEEHHGHIEIISPNDSEKNPGCSFNIQLPKYCADEQSSPLLEPETQNIDDEN